MTFTHQNRFKQTLEGINKWEIPEVEKERLKTYIEEYMSGDVTGLVTEAPERNLERVIEFLRPALTYINKDIKKLTEEDIKKFYTALLRDKILSFKGVPYVTTSKKRIYSTLKKYLEYHDIKTIILKPLKKRIKIVKTSKDILTEEDLDKLCIMASENWQRYAHQVLFWGGLRASEFLGLIEKDITLPEQNKSNFVKIKIRRENTKSDAGERVVSLWGKDCIKAVTDYLNERKAQGLKPNELIFNKKYDAVKSWLYRLSFKLNKPIHCHLYRHSSASLLCPSAKYFNGNLIKACNHFGWEYNSPVVKTYIRRKGLVEEDDIDKQVSDITLESVQDKLRDVELSKNMEIDKLMKMDELNRAVMGVMIKNLPKKLSEEDRKVLKACTVLAEKI